MEVDQQTFPPPEAERRRDQLPWLAEIAKRKSKEKDDTPTHLDPERCGMNCSISEDDLSVHFTGAGRGRFRGMNYDCGAVQANRPVPQGTALYYFEITVTDKGEVGAIGIGFTDDSFPLDRQPGWQPGTYGYHGDDGKLFHGWGMGDPFGPTFTTGDTAGAGINFVAREIFFTKNGELVGMTDLENPEDELYPTIGMHSLCEQADVNFGQRPFMFDVVEHEDWERQHRAVESVPIDIECGLVSI